MTEPASPRSRPSAACCPLTCSQAAHRHRHRRPGRHRLPPRCRRNGPGGSQPVLDLPGRRVAQLPRPARPAPRDGPGHRPHPRKLAAHRRSANSASAGCLLPPPAASPLTARPSRSATVGAGAHPPARLGRRPRQPHPRRARRRRARPAVAACRNTSTAATAHLWALAVQRPAAAACCATPPPSSGPRTWSSTSRRCSTARCSPTSCCCTCSATSPASRPSAQTAVPADCWLERWRTARHRVRHPRPRACSATASSRAIEALGTGFLSTPPTRDCSRARRRRTSQLSEDYHHALLRLVYRLLFLLRRRGPRRPARPGRRPAGRTQRYAEYFSTARLRRIAPARRGGTRTPTCGEACTLVLDGLGREDGRPELGLPALGGLFDHEPARHRCNGCQLANDALLTAVRSPVRRPRPCRRATARASTTATSAPRNSAASTSRCSNGPPPRPGRQRTFTLQTLRRQRTQDHRLLLHADLADRLPARHGPRPAARRSRAAADDPTGRAARAHRLRPGLRLRALPRRRRPPHRQPARHRPNRRPRADTGRRHLRRLQRGRRPLHLRRRRQPDGRRTGQGLASGSKPSSPAGHCPSSTPTSRSATPARRRRRPCSPTASPTPRSSRSKATTRSGPPRSRRRNKAEREAARRRKNCSPTPVCGSPTPNSRRATSDHRRHPSYRWPTRTRPPAATRELEASPVLQRAREVADAWCAAFVWPKTADRSARRHPEGAGAARPRRRRPLLAETAPRSPGSPASTASSTGT